MLLTLNNEEFNCYTMGIKQLILYYQTLSGTFARTEIQLW